MGLESEITKLGTTPFGHLSDYSEKIYRFKHFFLREKRVAFSRKQVRDEWKSRWRRKAPRKFFNS